jgi:hypothetical protein
MLTSHRRLEERVPNLTGEMFSAGDVEAHPTPIPAVDGCA